MVGEKLTTDKTNDKFNANVDKKFNPQETNFQKTQKNPEPKQPDKSQAIVIMPSEGNGLVCRNAVVRWKLQRDDAVLIHQQHRSNMAGLVLDSAGSMSTLLCQLEGQFLPSDLSQHHQAGTRHEE